MADVKRKLALFALYDRVGIEKTLEAASEKGWMLEKFGTFTWKYRKVEPKRRHVTVLYFPDASVYDPKPSEKEEFLEDLCANDGWELKLSCGQMKIFYNERENPTPIETDPLTQVENIHKAMKKKGNRDAWLYILLGVYFLALFGWQFWRNPAQALAGAYTVWLILDGLIMVLASAIHLISWKIWYRKALQAAAEGEYLEQHSMRGLTLAVYSITWLIALLMLTSLPGRIGFFFLAMLPVLVTIAVTNRVTKMMKQKGASRCTNLSVTIGTALVLAFLTMGTVTYLGIRFHLVSLSKPVGTYEMYGRSWDVYDNDLPLTVEDLTDTEQTEWSRDKDGMESFMAAQYFYRQWPLSEENDLPELSYTVTDVKFDCFYDMCKDSMLRRKQDEVIDGEVRSVYHYEPTDPAPWGAAEAYRVRDNYGLTEHYLLCYEGRIVELDLWAPPTLEQMVTVGEKFSPDF